MSNNLGARIQSAASAVSLKLDPITEGLAKVFSTEETFFPPKPPPPDPMASRWSPPVPLCSASDPTSFAFPSTHTRWPTILTNIVSELAATNGTLLGEADADKLKESKTLIQTIAGLIYEIRHDKALKPLEVVPGDLPNDIELYNQELERATKKNHGTWFSSSWLFAECYMYRRLRTIFASTTHWSSFDPFQSAKISAFRSSASGVIALASSLQTLVQSRANGSTQSKEDLHTEFMTFMATCLWGNATDLSLLTSLTHEDIQELQSAERGADFMLKNDLQACWEHLSGLSETGEKRIDIVLDNSGFELFADLILSDWLLTLSPFCTTVVFHPKLIPWFVSDVQPHDFDALLDSLLDPTFFPANAGIEKEGMDALLEMVERWKGHVESGRFSLSVPGGLEMGQQGGEKAAFWTAPNPFSDLPEIAPGLLTELQKASLVIFKDESSCIL